MGSYLATPSLPSPKPMDNQADPEYKRWCIKARFFIETFWKWRLRSCPEFATFSGFHDHDDMLENFTLKAIHNNYEHCTRLLKDALEFHDVDILDKDIQENLVFLENELSTYTSGHSAKGYLFPLNFLEGPHLEFERLIDTMPRTCLSDYLNILSRYKAFPVQMSQLIDLMREGIKQKMTFHEVSVKAVPEQLDKLAQLDILKTTPEKCSFYAPFIEFPETIPADKKEALKKHAVDSITNDIFPAFKALKEFLINEYLPNTRPEIASSSLPNGDDYYQMCLDFHLSCHMTPDEVHQIGLQEVKRITAEMEKVIATLELKLSVKEFSDKLRKDQDFYFENADELVNAYRGLVENQIYPLMSKVVNKVPEGKLKIEPIVTGPEAYYLAGTLDGRRPGVFYINVRDVKSSPKYNMVTLALHEAVPGHHLQMTHLMENKQLADFRKYLEDRKYSFAPSRFPFHTAYGEGWGLYCEYLGYELQLYEDPIFNYGHLSYEMLRAVRLVVDTGMHALGWSYEKALQYMLDHTALSVAIAESEVKRYITWPGQACAYKIGEIKLKSLREMAEQRLGSKFRVQEFHDVVLQNCGPLKVLEQKVNDYILKRCLED